MYKYFPHTEDEIQEMLKTIGVNSLEELYAEIPEELKVKHELNITPAKSEMEVRKQISLQYALPVLELMIITNQALYPTLHPVLSSQRLIPHIKPKYLKAHLPTSLSTKQ